jgi:hypothetical protein
MKRFPRLLLYLLLTMLLLCVLVFWRGFAKQEVIVQLIDAERGSPITNVTVAIVQISRTPFISGMRLLPGSWRYHTTWRTVSAPDGKFAFERISKGSWVWSQEAHCSVGTNVGPNVSYSFGRMIPWGFGSDPNRKYWRMLDSIQVPAKGLVKIEFTPYK